MNDNMKESKRQEFEAELAKLIEKYDEGDNKGSGSVSCTANSDGSWSCTATVTIQF